VPDIDRLADAMVDAMTVMEQLPATAQGDSEIHSTTGEYTR